MDNRNNKRQDRYRHGRKNEFGTLRDAQRQKRDRREQVKQPQPPKAGGGGERTRCEHCGGSLRTRGAVGHAGHLRWKCRKCGRTMWVRPNFKPPVPIVLVSRTGHFGG